VRTKPKISRLLAVAALLAGSYSTVNADSFKVATVPSAGQEPSAQPTSSFKVVTAPIPDQAPSARSDQAVAQGSQTDEPLPGEEFNPNRGAQPREFNPNRGAQPRGKSEGCSRNEATLPCAIKQQVILLPGTIRQVDFSQKIARVYPSDPDTVDATPINDHTIIIRPVRQTETVTNNNTNTTYTTSTPLRSGNSDVFVYDPDGNLISVIAVIVDPFAVGSALQHDPFAKSAGSVEIYNAKNLRETFNYRCAGFIGGCYYVGK
jgi:hypothetical protein